MSSEQKSFRFGDLLASEGTRNGIYKSKEFHGRGAKIVNMGELFAFPRLFNVEMKRVDIDSGEEGKFSLKAGDLLFARRSLVAKGAGKCSIVKEVDGVTVFESSIIRARVDATKADSEYLYYTFSSVVGRNLLGTILRQTAVSGITGTDLVELEIPLPPVANQKAIAHILGTLDNKIELNRKTNETLEEMAKALFKSWFVDLDPVRAKAEGRPTGLPDEISDLFPDSFEDSELGEIPSGWKVQSAGSQYEVSIGKTPPRKEAQWFSCSDRDLPWLSIRDLGEAGVYADKTSEYLTREAVERFNVKVVPANTVVVSFKLTVGRVAITSCEMLTNEAIAHFSPLRSDTGFEYTYCLLSQYDYHSLGSTSSIATAVNSQILRDMPLNTPTGGTMRAFCDTSATLFSSIKICQKETQHLSDLRDALLPKLISGEIRIPDAEKMLEEVGI